jgi:hypothetical protein
MYKILHIPTGEYVKDDKLIVSRFRKGISAHSHEYKDFTIENIPEDSFDRADLIRHIIFIKIHYTGNSAIKEACHSMFSEFIFVKV